MNAAFTQNPRNKVDRPGADRHRAGGPAVCPRQWHGVGAHHELCHPVHCFAGPQHRVGFAGLLDLGYIAFLCGGRLRVRTARLRTSACTCRVMISDRRAFVACIFGVRWAP